MKKIEDEIINAKFAYHEMIISPYKVFCKRIFIYQIGKAE